MNILNLLQEKNIIQYGDFKLKSGIKSNIYIDLRKVISFPKLHKEICNKIMEKINPDIDLICGTPYGAVSYASYISINSDIPMIFLRKEQKNHGTKKMIEGNYETNSKVVLIEDVTTTGSSIFETVNILEKHGLKVSQIITIISRHDNKTLYYNNKLIEYLYHVNDINGFNNSLIGKETCKILTNKLQSNTPVNEFLFNSLESEMIWPQSLIKNNKKSLKTIIKEKNTKICLAADVYKMDDLFNLINQVGHDICILKLHCDLIDNFYSNYNENIEILTELKKKYNFKIWEDRKLADIGSVMMRQISILSKWVDIISIHPISGEKGIEKITNMEIILILEMSTEGHLMNEEYQKNVLKIAENNNNVLGVVSQHKVSDKLMHFVPGISLNDKKDNLGQTYSNPLNKNFADVYVIGRGIYLSENPKQEVIKYKKII